MTVSVAARPLPRRRQSGWAPATGFEATLSDLATNRATGTLHGGAGSVHLAEGSVVGADSPQAPDLRSLLTGGGRLPADAWDDHPGHGGPAELLVQAGLVGAGELELCRLTALLDAAFFALRPTEGGLRFTPRVSVPCAVPRPLSVPALRAAVGRRRALLDRTWPWPHLDGAALRRCPAPAPEGRPARCPRRRRAVLDAADGRRTPSEIARHLGRSAYGVLLDVRHLAAAGLLEDAAPHDPPAPDPASHPSTDRDVALLLRLRAALEAL